MADGIPRITLGDIYRTTRPMPGVGEAHALTQEEILQLSDPRPEIQAQRPETAEKQGIFSRMLRWGINAMPESSDKPAPKDSNMDSRVNDDWTVATVEAAILNGEIDERVYAQIRKSKVGGKAAEMLLQHNVQIVDLGLPEDIFRPSTSSAGRLSTRGTPKSDVSRRENRLKKMNGLNQRTDALKNLIPGYRGMRIALSIGEAVTLVVVGIGCFKVVENKLYDPVLEISNSNSLVSGTLKYFKGLGETINEQVDISIPGGRR